MSRARGGGAGPPRNRGGAPANRSAGACWLHVAIAILGATIAPRAVGEQLRTRDPHEVGEQERSVGIDEVNRLVAAGTIRPVREVVAAAQMHAPGELIDVDLQIRRRRYVYEVEILRAGRRVEIYVDASTLALQARE